MWSTAEPVVGAWIAENLGPRGKFDDVSRGLASLAAFLADAPRRLEEIANRLDAASGAGPGEAFHGNSPRSRAITPTFVVVAISLTLMAILWYGWRR